MRCRAWPPAGRAGRLRQPRRRTGALARDARVRGALADAGIAAAHQQGPRHLRAQRGADGRPASRYSVFTPYKNAWLKQGGRVLHLRAYPVAPRGGAGALPAADLRARACRPTLADDRFRAWPTCTELRLPSGSSRGAATLLDDFLHRIDDYDRRKRDFPAVKGPSYLSVHLRFGTVSIRAAGARAHQLHAGAARAAPRCGCRN